MVADEELAARLADGDEEALAELLRRYQRPLSNFLYRNGAAADVEDLHQDTWMRVVRNISAFDPSRRFSTWLFQIAVNLCRDRYRRATSESPLEGEPPAAGSGMEGAEARLDAQRLLDRLSPLQREVIVLRFYQDLSEAEAAEILACPQGTVKSRTHNALARLAALAAGDEK
jgi:RNA polymerase sigma-70 factor, ECF subfamily